MFVRVQVPPGAPKNEVVTDIYRVAASFFVLCDTYQIHTTP